MKSTIRASGGLALAMLLLAACTTPTPVTVSLPPAPSAVIVGGAASSDGGAGVCRGKDPAVEAQATQGVSAANPANPYTGKDEYSNVVVKQGMIFYSLTPGAPPGFAVNAETLTSADGILLKYYDLVQVTTDPGKDAAGVPRKLRNQVRLFRVTEDICAARGIAKANPQFGRGGGTQYYVSPSDVAKLSPGESRPIEGATPSMQ